MQSKIFRATAGNPTAATDGVREALFDGGIVLATTDTVCGLITRSPSSLDRIFELKARPLTMPIAVLLAPDHPILLFIVREIPLTNAMFEIFPGPITIVLPRHIVDGMLPMDVAMLPWKTFGFRAPYYPPLWPVLESLGGMAFATSANAHGNPPAARIADVEPSIRESVDAILDGGNCPLGAPSTIAVLHGDDDWHISRSYGRLPRLYVEWENQASAEEAEKFSPAREAISLESLASSDVSGADNGYAVESSDAPFWSEPPLASLASASRVVYRNTANLSSSQRDVLSALAAWSRAGDLDR